MKSKLVLALAAVSLVAVGCGKNNPAATTAQIQSGTGIIGGDAVTESDAFARSIVAVYDVEVGGLCTGTIVAKNLIVTAGHCAQSDPSALRIVFGLNFDSNDNIVMGVADSTVNPQYAKTMLSIKTAIRKIVADAKLADPKFDVKNPSQEIVDQVLAVQSNTKSWGDIALLKLAGTIPAGYVPAQILTDKSVIQNNTPVLLAGYGITHAQTEQLAEFAKQRRMDTKVSPAGQPQPQEPTILRKVVVSVKDSGFSATEVLLDQTQGKGACHGDSGGPAYSEVNGKLYVWGVTSRGIQDPTDSCGSYSAYTNMVDHMSWLQRSASALGAAF